MSDTTRPVGGGGYVENPDFVPDLADLQSQFNTSGTGAHQNLDATTSVVAQDRQLVADQVLKALDPDNYEVKRSTVILPNDTETNEEALNRLIPLAKAIVKDPVVVGEPGPAEQAAANPVENSANMVVEGGTAGASPEPVGFTSTANSGPGSVERSSTTTSPDPTKSDKDNEVKADTPKVDATNADSTDEKKVTRTRRNA